MKKCLEFVGKCVLALDRTTAVYASVRRFGERILGIIREWATHLRAVCIEVPEIVTDVPKLRRMLIANT